MIPASLLPGRDRPATSPQLLRRLAYASLVSQVVIIVTGAAVRLTASGLGCPTWPKCTDESLTNTPEYGVHGFIEFGNRLLTYVLVAIAVAMLVAVVRSRPRRPDLRRLAVVLLLGIPLQGVIGGISVLTDLNPWVVGLHLLVSAVLVGIATVLVRRTGAGAGRGRLVVAPLLERLVQLQLAVLAAVIVAGTVVTGSGPHAGDREARRNGIDPETVSQLHADLVFLLVGITLATAIALTAVGAPAAARRAAWVLLGAELAQGVVGFVQYWTDLPVLLVGLHVLGAALLVVAGVRALDTLREPAPTAVLDGDDTAVAPATTMTSAAF